MTESNEARRLESQFCFALYSATHAVMRAYRPLLEPLGLTYPQYLVLLLLWEQGEQTVGGLAERMLLDSSTLTPLLKRLESLGLVHRQRNPNNERQLIVSLTPEGRALQEKAGAIPEAILKASNRSLTELLRLRDEMVGIREAFGAARADGLADSPVSPRPGPAGGEGDS